MQKRIEALSKTFQCIEQKLNEKDQELFQVIKQAEINNPWFIEDFVIQNLNHWTEITRKENIEKWSSQIPFDGENEEQKVGIILNSSTPLSAFYEIVCSLLLGYSLQIKLENKEKPLLVYLLNLWKEFYPELDYSFQLNPREINKLINDNQHIKEKNLNLYFKSSLNKNNPIFSTISILNGDETERELEALAEDVFADFGLSFRNVNKIYIPESYEISRLYKYFGNYFHLINHNKYVNNYEYHKAIFLLNGDLFWDNNMLLFKKEEIKIQSPTSVLFYQEYKNLQELESSLKDEKIMIVGNSEKLKNTFNNQEIIPFGRANLPTLEELEKQNETLRFLLNK